MEKWRVLPFNRFNAFENMAIDEAIFKESQKMDMPPTLRFYSWERDTVSMGYFQDVHREVNLDYCRENCIDVVRRPTGGKAVLHENDLTYSVVARENNPHFSSDIMETYRTISECLIGGLSRIGIEAYMMKSGRRYEKGVMDACCFSVPSQYELLVKERKICGSAQVRAKGAFLQHGSILIDTDPEHTCSAIIIGGSNAEESMEKFKASVTSIRENIGDGFGFTVSELCEAISETFEKRLHVQLVSGEVTREEESLKA
ncbi:MAG: lipoate--protein ligase family protein, partial [Deltaproteobacteria bacterium]|nr:lipoate--protein ligase family protein [Deltaproteobacteria bacterium]